MSFKEPEVSNKEKVYELGKNNPIVHGYLTAVEHNQLTYEEALEFMVLQLARVGDAYYEQLVTMQQQFGAPKEAEERDE